MLLITAQWSFTNTHRSFPSLMVNKAQVVHHRKFAIIAHGESKDADNEDCGDECERYKL